MDKLKLQTRILIGMFICFLVLPSVASEPPLVEGWFLHGKLHFLTPDNQQIDLSHLHKDMLSRVENANTLGKEFGSW
jgi:hypothetical protein